MKHLFTVKFPFLILTISIIFSMGCAAPYPPVPSTTPSPHEAQELISDLLSQEDRISSFYSLGTVVVKGWVFKSEAAILVAGTRKPFKMKIEITHPWGMPVLHILVENQSIKVLSFEEKRIYTGNITAEALSDLLPASFWDPAVIWSVLRGYTPIACYDGIGFSGTNRISLMDEKGMEIEIIDLYPEHFLPKRASFPGEPWYISFSGFKENDGIYYASEVSVNNIKGERDLVLNRKDMVFNKSIPDQIFVLEKPAGFDTVYLD
jgi:hypothetical protein